MYRPKHSTAIEAAKTVHVPERDGTLNQAVEIEQPPYHHERGPLQPSMQ